MPTKIVQLDWRSDPTLIAAQEAAANQFLLTRTIQFAIAEDEYIAVIYTNTVPANPSKVKVFSLSNSIMQNGISQTEANIDAFLVGKTVQQILKLDDGNILLVYR